MPLFLAGGGSARDEAMVWQAAFDGVSRVLYWPFALPPARLEAAERWFHESLTMLAIEVEVTTWTTPQGRDLGGIGETDLVFVGGGSTSRLATALREAELMEPVRRFVREGGRYYGGSAGAVLPAERITIAAMLADDPAAHDMAGLGALSGLSVLPHANRYPDETPHQASEALGEPVLALPEASGVRVDGRRLRVLGHDAARLASRGVL